MNQAVDQAFNISTIYRVVHISRHQTSWTKPNFKFQLKSLKHASRAQQTTFLSTTENTEAATFFTLRSSLHQLFMWARAQQTTERISIQVKFKCGQQYSSIGADMGGQHQQWCCVGDAISRNTRSNFIRLNTRGSMAQGYRKRWCSACGGSAPCPKTPC